MFAAGIGIQRHFRDYVWSAGMNAAGRLETAQYALDMLTARLEALELGVLNIKRRYSGREIFDGSHAGSKDNMTDDRVLW